MLKKWRIAEVEAYKERLVQNFLGMHSAIHTEYEEAGLTDRPVDVPRARRLLTNWQNVSRCLSACEIAIAVGDPACMWQVSRAPMLPAPLVVRIKRKLPLRLDTVNMMTVDAAAKIYEGLLSLPPGWQRPSRFIEHESWRSPWVISDATPDNLPPRTVLEVRHAVYPGLAWKVLA